MPYDPRLGNLRARANDLRHRLEGWETVVRVNPEQIEHHRWAARNLQEQLDVGKRFIARYRPALEQMVQEIRRLEAEQAKVSVSVPVGPFEVGWRNKR